MVFQIQFYQSELLVACLTLLASCAGSGLLSMGLVGLRRKLTHPARHLLANLFEDCIADGPSQVTEHADGFWSIRFRVRGSLFQLAFRLPGKGHKAMEVTDMKLEELTLVLPSANDEELRLFCQQAVFLTQAYGGLLTVSSQYMRWRRPFRQPGAFINPLVHVLALHCPTKDLVMKNED